MSNLQPLPFSSFPTFATLKQCVQQAGALRKSDARIVFVCGANQTKTGEKSRRAWFMEYAKKHLASFRFFLAEDVFDALGGSTAEDLLTIEDRLGDFSDCIIIFCESESAFSELGAFTLKNELVKQVLIVNDRKFRAEKSFINRGPIARADKHSRFKPVIHADFGAILKSAAAIKERLEAKIPHRRDQRIKFNKFSRFSELDAKDRLFLIADFVHLFGPITTSELVGILSDILGIPITSMDTELALGRSLGLFRHVAGAHGKFLASPVGEVFSFFGFDFSLFRPADLRAQVVRYYFHNERERLILAAAATA